MSPVGKPTPDGEIEKGSRLYSGRPAPLGVLSVWSCPACGKQNEGRKPEQGCAHCGAGDQSKGKAGGSTAVERVHAPMRPLPDAPSRLPEPRTGSAGNAEVRGPVEPLRILRLIEYLIHPGQDADATLRRSLVGRMEMPWGTITATIVDSVDSRQEDLLRLAHRQPGVWMANPEAMHEKTPPRDRVRIQTAAQWAAESTFAAADLAEEEHRYAMENPTPPDTGPSFTPDQAKIAQTIVLGYGYRIANTIALALSAIAEEVAGNMEPEKFLTREECLQLANALIQQLPDDWTGEPAPEEAQNAD